MIEFSRFYCLLRSVFHAKKLVELNDELLKLWSHLNQTFPCSHVHFAKKCLQGKINFINCIIRVCIMLIQTLHQEVNKYFCCSVTPTSVSSQGFEMIGILKLSFWLTYSRDWSWSWTDTTHDVFPKSNTLQVFVSFFVTRAEWSA
jgi:hypothetical protein